MANYTFTVPPTRDVGSFVGTCSTRKHSTKESDALWTYNGERAHNFKGPLKQMPKGTTYKRILTTRMEYVVQGYYGACGWEDESTEESWKEGRRSLKEYQANGIGYYRLIGRRVKVKA